MAKNPKSKIQNQKSAKLVAALLDWFAAHARDLPWRRTRDPYAIWVSEIMLQQTQVKTVIPYWERWLRELPDVAALAAAAPAKIHKLWEGLGYYTRVRNMQRAAQQIVAQHAGQFPRDFDAVLALPGIGRYTTGAICSIAYNRPAPILDGNVIRILTRIFGIAGDPREKQTNARLWQLAAELVTHAKAAKTAKDFRRSPWRSSRPSREKNSCSYFNQSMMELGALICTPRNPQCEICPAKKLCVARREHRVAELPNLAKRVAATERRFVAFVVERQGKFLVRQRPAGVVNAHLWEFPNEELAGDLNPPAVAEALRLAPHSLAPLCTVRHSITRYRITLEAYRAQPRPGTPASGPARPSKPNGTPPGRRPALQGRWFFLADLDEFAFTSAHRKVLEHLNRSESNCVQESKPQPRKKS